MYNYIKKSYFLFFLLSIDASAENIRVFDVIESLDGEQRSYRIVKISFEKDPEYRSLKNSTAEIYSSCVPAKIKWDHDPMSLAYLVGMNTYPINNINIEDIRNQADLNYSIQFLKTIHRYTTEDVYRFLSASNTTTVEWKDRVNTYNENVKNRIDENMEEKMSNHQSSMAELNETYRKGDVDFPEEDISCLDYSTTMNSDDDDSHNDYTRDNSSNEY